MSEQVLNTESTPWYKKIHWTNTIFLIGSPILVVLCVPMHIIQEGFDWRLIALFFVFWAATGISITGGYHRLLAHRSYEANTILKLFYLLFGAAAFQGSALKWASDHRRHHKHIDTDTDPYSIKKGFFYAHIGWLFVKDDPRFFGKFERDLERDTLIAWQHKYYIPIGVIVGFLIPTLIGLYFGLPWEGLVYGGFARTVILHHTTFFINSLCHMWGWQPYNKMVSAKDNFILAFFTYGEGFHNFHHKFEADYRNGIKWYHWDPTKWFIKFAAIFRFAKNLRKISDFEILKAKLAVQESFLAQKGKYNEQLLLVKKKIEETHKNIIRLKNSYNEYKRDLSASRQEKLREIRREIKLAKQEFRAALDQWQTAYALAHA